MSRYKMKKFYAWSSEIAYLAGLFASDGCLLNNGRHLNITSKDEEIIRYCQRILGKVTKIAIKHGQFGTSAYSWQFSDVALYDFLSSTGITPQKSKTITNVTIPDNYWGDFLRGYFDGDGTSFGFTDRRWKNAKMFYIGFVSASNEFLRWVCEQNTRLVHTTGTSIHRGVRANTLTYAKLDSKRLYACMYSEGTCANMYSLQRKKTKLEAFIEAA